MAPKGAHPESASVAPPQTPRLRSSARVAVDWVFIAGVYGQLGKTDQAFAWLEKAVENRDFFMTYVQVHPHMDPLRSDPRFARVLQAVRVPRGKGAALFETCENLSAFVPVEIDAIEKTMKEPGLRSRR